MLTRTEAREILARCHVPLGADYHKLDSDTVEYIVAMAKGYRYRKPRNANGSTARYFHAYLQRRAAGEPNPL
jgi:hypothetical protein